MTAHRRIRAPGPARREMRAMLTLAWPLVLSNVAMAAINTVDVLILGRYDVRALAAAALAVNIFFAFAVFAMGLVTAASPLIASEYGRRFNSVREIRRTVRQGIWASFFVCLPIWAALWQSEAIFLLLGQEPDLSDAAAEFVRIAMWGLFPWLIAYVLRVYVTALEEPLWGLGIVVLGLLFNGLSSWILVFGKFGAPELGLIGAAVTNALASLLMAVLSIVVVQRSPRFRRYRLFGHFWRADWPRLRRILAIGLPIGVIYAMESSVFNAAVFLMGLLGETALAAHAIAVQLASLAFMIPLGLGQAATVRVGIFHGRGDGAGVARAGRVVLALGLGAAAASATAMILFPEWLVGFFLDPRSERDFEVFSLATSFLFVAALFQFADGSQAIGAGLLRGLQDTRVPMIFAGLGYWLVGLGLSWLLAFEFEMGGIGIWIGLAAGLGVVAAMMLSRWVFRRRFGVEGLA